MQRVTELAIGYPEGRLELQLVGGYSDPRGYSEDLFYNILCTWSKQLFLVIFFLNSMWWKNYCKLFVILAAFHKQQTYEIDLTLCCVAESNTTVRNGIHWPLIYGIGLNVKTGEIFPATFPDKGPDQALRQARHLTGGQQVEFSSSSIQKIKLLFMFNHNFYLGPWYLRLHAWSVKNWSFQLWSTTRNRFVVSTVWSVYIATFVHIARRRTASFCFSSKFILWRLLFDLSIKYDLVQVHSFLIWSLFVLL